MEKMSSLRKDFIAGHLRTQLSTLKTVLDTIENSDRIKDDCFDESLKRIATNVCQLRKLCTHN